MNTDDLQLTDGNPMTRDLGEAILLLGAFFTILSAMLALMTVLESSLMTSAERMRNWTTPSTETPELSPAGIRDSGQPAV